MLILDKYCGPIVFSEIIMLEVCVCVSKGFISITYVSSSLSLPIKSNKNIFCSETPGRLDILL